MSTIRNNIILFIIRTPTNKRKYSLIRGEFFIKRSGIPVGLRQPGEVANGDTLYCSDNGEFNFRVNRKASAYVAWWFNKECDPNTSTTFGHPAGK